MPFASSAGHPTTVIGFWECGDPGSGCVLQGKHGWCFSCSTTGFPSSNHPAGIWDGMRFLEHYHQSDASRASTFNVAEAWGSLPYL